MTVTAMNFARQAREASQKTGLLYLYLYSPSPNFLSFFCTRIQLFKSVTDRESSLPRWQDRGLERQHQTQWMGAKAKHRQHSRI